MYIQLTRLDNSPIWLNAAFVVTIEPRKGGGAIVVPIGDGLDYEVRETPDVVLKMLEGAPVATVVPVPAPNGLTPTPEDVSPEPAKPEASAAEAAPEEAPAAPVKKVRRTKKAAAADGAEPKPARKSRTKAKKPAVEFPAEQVERLKKMMPGSMRKLVNTLVTQFKVADADSVVALLEADGIITVDRDHIIWKAGPEVSP